MMPLAPRDRRRAVGIALAALLLDSMAYGTLLPILPDFIASFGVDDRQQAAITAGLLIFSFSICQFVFAPIMGGLSDRYGRRIVMVITLIALAIDYLLMAMTDSIAVVFAGRALSGALAATYAVATSIGADCTPPEGRAKVFGLATGAIGAGFVIGPAAGALLGESSLRLPFYLSSIAFAVLALAACVMLPETLARDRRRKVDPVEFVPLYNLNGLRADRFSLLLLIGVAITYLFSHAYFSVWPFFAAEVLDWDLRAIGYSMTIYGVLLVMVSAFVVGPAARLLGNQTLAWASLLPAIVSFACLAWARSDVAVISSLLIGGFSAGCVPAIQATLSPFFGEDHQGRLQGLVGSMQALGTVLGPPLLYGIFALTVGGGSMLQGVVFTVAAAGLAFAMLIILTARPLNRQSATD